MCDQQLDSDHVPSHETLSVKDQFSQEQLARSYDYANDPRLADQIEHFGLQFAMIQHGIRQEGCGE